MWKCGAFFCKQLVLMPAGLVLELVTNASGDTARDLHAETEHMLGGSISNNNWQTSDLLLWVGRKVSEEGFDQLWRSSMA